MLQVDTPVRVTLGTNSQPVKMYRPPVMLPPRKKYLTSFLHVHVILEFTNFQ